MSTPQIDDIDALCKLAYEGKIVELTDKLEHRTDNLSIDRPDKSGRSLLHWAAAGGHVDIAKLLIDTYRADPNAGDEAGWSPLLIATSAGRQRVVALLLAAGVDVNSVNATGQCALHYAASKDRREIAHMLLERDANANIGDHLLNTPLHRAACLGHTVLSQLLLDHGARPNAANKEGNTPLHLACEEDREADMHLLLKAGAKLDVQNKEEKTPVEVAAPGLRKVLENLWKKQQEQEQEVAR